MELLNALNKYDAITTEKNDSLLKETFIDLILLLAPCAPHFTEEIWEQLGNKKSIFNANYPVCDEKWLVKDEIEVAVQVNSKIKCKMMVPAKITEDEVKDLISKDEKILPFIDGKVIKKIIIIPGRLINIIV